MFKRNNYRTMVIGKMQPIGSIMTGTNETNAYFVDGARAWGFDKSFNSRNYCCFPGAGYFVNDQPQQQFDRWGVFSDFRYHGDISISEEAEQKFYSNPKHYHLLDGYVNPTMYKGFTDTNQTESFTSKGKPWIRFVERPTGKVLVANLIVSTRHETSSNFEFAVNGTTYASFEEANRVRKQMIADCPDGDPCQKLKHTVPKRTQLNFDSRFITRTFHETAIDYIEQHVTERNPKMMKNKKRTEKQNQPFFMYLAFRGPHMPYSHEYTFNPKRPYEHMPYASFGKSGEQIGLMDRFIGELMKTLHKLDIADNTLVMFTSDNGPDQSALKPFNRFGHIRTQMLRGLKGGMYEGSTRVPLLTWWPLGTHKALYGTNFDLPIGQIDFFATFADILNYPLPKGDKCIYGFDSKSAPSDQDPATLGRTARSQKLSFGKYLKSLRTSEFRNSSRSSFSSIVQVSRDQNMELKVFGFKTVQKYKTQEPLTGFLVGWDACMAEDSHSFLSAFQVKNESPPVQQGQNGEYVEFERKLKKVSTKLYTDQNGGVAIRLGRYKLMRFNPPKDLRTGFNNQHLNKVARHEGIEWLDADWDERCSYATDGTSLNPKCSIEPLCRNHTTFGVTSCMRDHYYQLWDLEKNFGEKMSCAADRSEDDNIIELMDHSSSHKTALLNIGAVKKEGRPTDRWGIGTGTESTPVSNPKPRLNDCCKVSGKGDCTVTEHSGPLAEGWEANSQWKENKSRFKRRVKNGEVDEKDFKIWTPFVHCLKAVMEIMEGQAKYPVAFETFDRNNRDKPGTVNLDRAPTVDTENVEGRKTGATLHGIPVGSSSSAQKRQDYLWQFIDSRRHRKRTFHGAGSRFIDDEKVLVEECLRHLPKKTPKPYNIQVFLKSSKKFITIY